MRAFARIACLVFLAAWPALASEKPQPTRAVSEPDPSFGISSNPSAVNAVAGTGEVERLFLDLLGIKDDHGVQVGGVWIGNSSWLMSGGAEPGKVSWNNLFIADLIIDTEKLTGWWKDGTIGVEFLQFNGEDTNAQAGTVQGYNSLPGSGPLNRSELYQLWVFQSLFDGKASIRLGKSLPSVEFGNVLEPIALTEKQLVIPAVSGLMYTPIFVNPTMLGIIPGYYNSACGVTASVMPVDWWYFKYGFYDGSMASGVQTGMTGPNFTGHYLSIWETGFTWHAGDERLPGKIAAGYWYQSGLLTGPTGITEDGASGFYLYGSQRLWYQHPGKDSSGISAFFQFGVNDSRTLTTNEYFGMGVSGVGLVPGRLKDSMGVGMSWAWLNRNNSNRPSELMFQAYYQANVWRSFYLEPAITYIPTPGADSSLGGAWASTIQAVFLF